MFDILNKLGDFRSRMEAVKTRMDSIYIDEQTADGLIKVSVTANRKVTSISIDPSLVQQGDGEAIQEMLEIVLNRALDNAEKVAEAEMKAAGKDLLPGMPGL